MKVVVRKGLVTVENTHDLFRRSFMYFLSKKKPSIFNYVDSEISESEYNGKMHVVFNHDKHNVKDIKPLVSEIKALWKESKNYQHIGYAKSQLLARGWTNGAIHKFLGKCDCELKNPYHKSGSPMQIFYIKRVIKMESCEKWQEWYEGSLSKRQKLSDVSSKRAEQARSELFKQISSIAISFPSYSKNELYRKAIEHYNNLAYYRDKEPVELFECNKEFLHRICVNYLRHRYNGYENRLDRMSGQIGCKDAYYILKSRILETIAENFKFLKLAVEQQLERLDMLDSFEKR